MSLTWDLLLGELGKMVHLPLIRSPRSVPEEEPLQSFVALELIRETKDILLVGEFEEIEELGARLHDGERRVLVVIDDDRDTT